MSILTLFIIIIAIGVFVWAAVTFLKMDERFKTILVWAAVAVVILLCLHAFGVFSAVRDVDVPRVD